MCSIAHIGLKPAIRCGVAERQLMAVLSPTTIKVEALLAYEHLARSRTSATRATCF